MVKADSDNPLAGMDFNSNPLLSNCNEESTVDATSFTNDDVEFTLVDATTATACKIERTSDIVACIETSGSPGLFGT